MAEPFQVYDDVPLPAINRSPRGTSSKYPLKTMRVGQMFFVEGRKAKSVSAYVSRISKGMAEKFSARHCWVVFENGAPVEVSAETKGAREGAGVWRIE